MTSARGERAGLPGSLPARAASPFPPRRGRTSAQTAQATVELALVLPFVVMLMLLLVQVGILVRDQVLVVHAAREGAREAAVEPAPGAARSAALASSGLDPDRLEIDVSGRDGPGSRVKVTASYRAPTGVPVVGAALGDMRLQASATMRVER